MRSIDIHLKYSNFIREKNKFYPKNQESVYISNYIDEMGLIIQKIIKSAKKYKIEYFSIPSVYIPFNILGFKRWARTNTGVIKSTNITERSINFTLTTIIIDDVSDEILKKDYQFDL